ncbi:MAG: hypothetical protein AB7T49_19350 [Oligoflexales bacterium]
MLARFIVSFVVMLSMASCRSTNTGSEAKQMGVNKGILWDYPFYCKTEFLDDEGEVIHSATEDTQFKSTDIKATGVETNERHYSLNYTDPRTGVNVVAKATSTTEEEPGKVRYRGVVEKMQVTLPDGKTDIVKIEDTTPRRTFNVKSTFYETNVETPEGTATAVEVKCGFYVWADEEPVGD